MTSDHGVDVSETVTDDDDDEAVDVSETVTDDDEAVDDHCEWCVLVSVLNKTESS